MERRLDLIEDKSATSPTVPGAAPVTPRPAFVNKADEEVDSISLAPSSQEGSFLSDNCLSPVPSVDEVGLSQEQIPVENLTLKAKVYAIRRELSGPNSSVSPPRSSHKPSDFQSCSGLVRDSSKSYASFPESSHFKSALASINAHLVEDQRPSNKASNLVRQNLAFSTSSFPGKVRMKYFDIHDVSLGKSQPVFDKTFSNFLGAKSSEGVKLSQTSYSRCFRSFTVCGALSCCGSCLS